MAIYTVHVRPGAGRAAEGGDVALTREGFSNWAFLTGPFWFAVNRCWFALAVWVAAYGALIAAARWFGMAVTTLDTLALIGAVLVGLEANNLRRGALERRGYRAVDVVSGPSLEDAERSYFRRAGLAPSSSRATAAPPPAAPRLPNVGGLFPGAGG